MSKLVQIPLILIITFILSEACYAISFGSISSSYSDSARTLAKYYPQNTRYVNRYAQSQKSYIYSSQQAKYYGYRVPDQTTNNPYYNQYSRGY